MKFGLDTFKGMLDRIPHAVPSKKNADAKEAQQKKQPKTEKKVPVGKKTAKSQKQEEIKTEEATEEKKTRRFGIFSLLRTQIAKIMPYGTPIEKIYLLVILVAFILSLFKSGSIVTEDKVVLLVIFAGGLFILRSLRRKVYFPRRYTILAGLFLLVSVISVLVSINIYNSLLGLSMLFAGILISIIGYDIIYGKYSRRWILNALLFVVSLVVAWSIFLYVQQRTALVYPLGLPMYMGTLIAAFLPFSLSSTLKTRGVKQAAFLISILLLITGSVLTYSIPVYVVIGCEVAFFFALNIFVGRKALRKRHLFTPITAVIVIAVAAGILLHFASSGQIPFGPDSYADRSFPMQLRFAILLQGWESFKSSMLSIFFGTGLDNFKIVSLYHQAAAWNLSYHMNSDLLEMFVNEGLVGGLAFFALIGYVLFEIFRKKNFTKIFKKQNNESLELSIGIIAILVFAAFSPVLHVVVILVVFFLFIGILLKDINVDNVKRYYLGNLSIGLVNGVALFFIVLTIFFFATNFIFSRVRDSISQSNLAESQKQVEQLVHINPVDSEYASYLSQIYLAQNQFDKAASANTQAMQYNKQSPYLRYTDALLDYFNHNTSRAQSKVSTLLKEAPYADPSFYLLPLQIDQDNKNDAAFKSDLEAAVHKFPLNDTYKMYRQMFSDLGFSDSVAKLYLELGILTNDPKYIKMAQDASPQGLSIFGQ